MFQLYLKGIGILAGMIFGAGMFALPYVFSRAGIFWGLFHFAVAFLILIFLHLWYGEIAYYTRGEHRFTGYVELFLGAKAKLFAFFVTIGSYYGTLLIYGILGGIFLSNIFSQFSPVQMSVLFFVFAGIFGLGNIGRIATINFYLTIPLLGFIVYLLFTAMPAIDINNFFSNAKVFNGNWFLPFGVWLFAMSGFSVIPEARDIFSKFPIKNFKRVIWISLLLSAVFYFIFIIAVWGASGGLTTEDALSGIAGILGRGAFLIGSFIGFLAVFTSYIALATDMRLIFAYDYKISNVSAWLYSIIPPVIIFFVGAQNFIKTLGIIGTLGMGMLGVFIIWMRHRLAKKIFVKQYIILEIFILIGVLTGVFYELWRIF